MSHLSSNSEKSFLRVFFMSLLFSLILIFSSLTAKAASYGTDWRNWKQKQSDYATMRSGGCRIVSYAKLLKATGLVNDPNFNPDRLFEWCAANHKVVSLSNVNEYSPIGTTPPDYARNVLGKTVVQHNYVSLSGGDEQRRQTIINYSRNGYLVVICGTNHFTYVDEERTRASGELWVDDSGYGVQKVTTKAGGYNLTKYDKIRIFTAESPAPPVPTGSAMASGYNRTLPDGNYIIAAAADPSYYLDIAGSAVPASNGENVNLWHVDNMDVPTHDAWNIKYEGGFYTITQLGSDAALDVYAASAAAGTNVQVHQSHGGDNQKWAISTNGRNGYRIQSKCSGYSLDISNGTIADGTNVTQYVGNDSNAQSWVFIPYNPSQPIQNGRYILTSAIANNIELDVVGDTGNIPNPTNVRVWNDNCPSKFNSFDVEKLSNGYYKLTHAASGKVLDLYGASTTYQANVCVHDANGSIAQQWAIIHSGNGYALIPRCSGFCVDVEGSGTSNGTNVQQWPYNGDTIQANQTWKFVPAEYSIKYDANGGSGAPSSQIKYYKNAVTLASAKPTRSGYSFAGWSTSKTSTRVDYNPGALYNKDASITLYAKWVKLASTQPQNQRSNNTGSNNQNKNSQSKNSGTKDTKSETIENAAPSHKAGDIVQDVITNATYSIISTDEGSRSVIYTSTSAPFAKEITIPESITIDNNVYIVTDINDYAFKNNTNIKKIVIGKNIQRIGKQAFYGCKKLKKIKIETTSLTKNSIGKNAFKKINAKAKVVVPKSNLKNYKKILKSKGISGASQKITK
ncbi:RICIN domain-containing protein [Butyrivibrio sp. LC3010]|uniref:RICIN domain-containing protein n=1 Tax=Butyrivibrio sp. LC3010 TaxID=1280680 RepID=UPI000425BDF0|nr:RICIN domain-containing protein [Butyrivibrio sp. LC3010]